VTAARLPALVLGVLLVVAAAAAAIAVNVLLLDRASAQSDPVGRLAPGARVVPAAPKWTVRPVTGPIEDRGADD
jgi:hypothetical protein